MVAFPCLPVFPASKSLFCSVVITINQLSAQPPFTTKDGSTIRSILDRTIAPVSNQSLAEATVSPGGSTQRQVRLECMSLSGSRWMHPSVTLRAG